MAEVKEYTSKQEILNALSGAPDYLNNPELAPLLTKTIEALLPHGKDGLALVSTAEVAMLYNAPIELQKAVKARMVVAAKLPVSAILEINDILDKLMENAEFQKRHGIESERRFPRK